MTDKQLERANQIKKEIIEFEKLREVTVSFSHAPDDTIDIWSNEIYQPFQKIQNRLTKSWEKLCDDKLTALKKEFAKL